MSEHRVDWSGFEADPSAESYLLDAFRSGWVSGGAYVQRFENICQERFGSAKALSVTNGTAALQLAFQTLNIKPQDKVLVPAFCFQAAANVLDQLGAIPIFVDADPFTWNVTVSNLDVAFQEGVVGVVVVYNYGFSADISDISTWAEQKGVWLIEDCAEAWFSAFEEKYLGTHGDIATFSLHAAKTISAGEGGLVLINDESLVERAVLMRSHGFSPQTPKYFHNVPGHNYRMSNLHCAVAFAQMERADEILCKQRYIMNRYEELLDSCDLVRRQRSLLGAQDEIWAFAVELDTTKLSLLRDDVIMELASRGIDCRPGFYTPECFPRASSLHNVNWPTASRLAKNILVLPCDKSMTETEVTLVCQELTSILERHRRFTCDCSFIELQTSPDGVAHLQAFLANLGTSSETFRYFQNRELSVISQHLESLILLVDGTPVGYGHLDPEDGKVWLGVAITESAVGRGFGDLITTELITRGSSKQLTDIYLRVDRDNSRAQTLYARHGFKLESNLETCYELKLRLPELQSMSLCI